MCTQCCALCTLLFLCQVQNFIADMTKFPFFLFSIYMVGGRFIHIIHIITISQLVVQMTKARMKNSPNAVPPFYVFILWYWQHPRVCSVGKNHVSIKGLRVRVFPEGKKFTKYFWVPFPWKKCMPMLVYHSLYGSIARAYFAQFIPSYLCNTVLFLAAAPYNSVYCHFHSCRHT